MTATLQTNDDQQPADAARDLLSADLFGYEAMLTPDEWAVVQRTREFMATHVAPVAQDCWARAEFPFQIIEPLAEVGIIGRAYGLDGAPAASQLLTGFVGLEIARVDPSIATFIGVHSGLAMGTIVLCGSPEQQQRWLPAMQRMELIGAFGLTEPEGGSDVAGGMRTTARRSGDGWILNGAKRWIGNATFADLTIIWARDVADDSVKGFVVEKDTPGFVATKIENKASLRTVQNADIVLTDCRVDEAHRLQNANSFRDTARVLRTTRGGVTWSAVGCQIGAYDAAVEYAKEREQFGQPIGHFQLIQDLLARMLGQHHRIAGHGGAGLAAAAGGHLPRRAGRPGQVVLHHQAPGNRGLGTGSHGRQRDPARPGRRAVLRRRRGALLLRGHRADQRADRRPGDHRQVRVRLRNGGGSGIVAGSVVRAHRDLVAQTRAAQELEPVPAPELAGVVPVLRSLRRAADPSPDR